MTERKGLYHTHLALMLALTTSYNVQVREMEAKLKQYGISEMTTNPQDFISRKDHARICDARVAAREADLQVSQTPFAPFRDVFASCTWYEQFCNVQKGKAMHL